MLITSLLNSDFKNSKLLIKTKKNIYIFLKFFLHYFIESKINLSNSAFWRLFTLSICPTFLWDLVLPSVPVSYLSLTFYFQQCASLSSVRNKSVVQSSSLSPFTVRQGRSPVLLIPLLL